LLEIEKNVSRTLFPAAGKCASRAYGKHFLGPAYLLQPSASTLTFAAFKIVIQILPPRRMHVVNEQDRVV